MPVRLKDIRTRKDIKTLVDLFYDRVKADKELGELFNGIFEISWQHHLPRLYDFWENALFYSGGYTGNPIKAHEIIHQKNQLNHELFLRWTGIWCQTVDQLFKGAHADMAKDKAKSIGSIMEVKLFGF
jgi:hemoglobin